MNEYTASNGITVKGQVDGGFYIRDDCHANSARAQAIREYIIAKEDERLGRWRWPANPDYVVYAWTADPPRNDKRGVTVLSEAIPRGYTVWEDNVDTLYGTSENEEARVLARKAARAYFDAHPEPKPTWYAAKPGEVWEVKSDFGTFNAWRLESGAFMFDDESWLFEDQITAGRRIWPES